MRSLDVSNGSNGSNLPTYVNGSGKEGQGKLRAYWEAQRERARDFWVNMESEGRLAIAGIFVLLALSVGTVVLGTCRAMPPCVWDCRNDTRRRPARGC